MSRDEDLLIQILNKVSDVSERLVAVESQCQTMQKDISYIKEEDAQQNKLLAEHIEGVKTNKQRLDLEVEKNEDYRVKSKEIFRQHNERLDSLETPGKVMKALKSAAGWIITIGSAGALIAKWLKLW